LQPFVSLSASWTGRTSLGTLTNFEAQTQRWFKGKALASAFYLSELVMRLVGEREAHPRLFVGLQWSLDNIETDLELVLRSFEKLLLEELGYGLDFELDTDGNPIEDQTVYQLIPDRGFQMCSEGFSGALLKRVGQEDFAAREVRRVAKKVLREALSHQLGPKPLASRWLLAGRP
jgi:DNA repair protein RecO (recombination protein O)